MIEISFLILKKINIKTKKIISSVVLASTLLLNFSSTAFAITVAETAIVAEGGAGHKIMDMVVSSSGVTHYLQRRSSGGYNLLEWGDDFTVSWTGIDTDSSATNVNVTASMALDSGGNPGFVWQEWDTVGNTSKLYYRKATSGGSFGTTVEVATDLGLESVVPSLAFYRDGADTDYASIVTCGDSGTYPITEYKATSSALTPSFGGPVAVSTNGDHGCSGSDLYVTGTDELHLVVAPKGAGTTSYYFNQSNGSWSANASTVFTGVDVQQSSNVFIDVNSNNNIFAVIIDDAAADGTDYIRYNEYAFGSWGTQSTVASGAHIGQNQIDIVLDQDNGYPYVLYFDNVNNAIKYAYSTDNGSNWTAANIDSGFTLGTGGGDYFNSIAGGYYSSGTKIYAAAVGYLSSTYTFMSGYEITDLAGGGGGGGGEGVPEFSTLVYITTVLLMFGMVYWKNEGGNMQNA